MATVMVGATASFWLLGDIFDAHPAGVSNDDFVDALVSLVEAWFDQPAPPQN